MNIGQAFSFRASSFGMGPKFFASVHEVGITGEGNAPILLAVNFTNYFISSPAYFGAASTTDSNGNVVTLTIDSNIQLVSGEDNLFYGASLAVNPSGAVGTFTTTMCIVFIGNGTY
jgi:hypothetical protein